MSLAEFLFELLSDNPHLPEIRRFHPMVNEIITSNKQKYDHIRRNNALESNISTSYFEMSFSIIDIITFIRRFYLDLFRTGNVFSIILKDGFYIGFLTLNCILFSCLIDKLLLDKLKPEENEFNDLIEGAKVYYTPDMKKYTSFFLFHLFSHFGTLISFFIRNICNKRSQILEDIYSAKYSVLTCFVGYFIHDFTLTLFSFGFGACTIVWCGLGPLINYWYLIFFFSMVFCYAINFIFLKCLIGFSCYSNYFSIILFLFNFFIGKEMGLMSPEFELTGVLKIFTYPKYLSFFFPQLLLNAIFNYMNTEIVKSNTSGSGLKENRDFIPFISSKEFEGIEPKDAFSIIGLSSCPFRVFVLVFVLSLLINIFSSLYFFNRHIGAMLRLKMNKQ
ncbi:hypothetical protein NBO_366g0001 [Nosema bombycis CQ1]|uniref:Uncharacterized protein n=1 Tax=Nosema bombycis (strain CQ1 / CVCC 102059) TaxID=578461 RepID=R0MJ02_NOSB1|nr:hypothetical protein NBO_366g0001 [Nosema bombycis CQ1]|eukprot:EOB12778.1 hypothetical protein NBO_366g0001 [Nosema bombycis CQ1]